MFIFDDKVVIKRHVPYGEYAKDLAGQGYYALLFNGTDFWGKGLSRNNLGLDRLKAVLARAKIASCTPWKGGCYRFFGWRREPA